MWLYSRVSHHLRYLDPISECLGSCSASIFSSALSSGTGKAPDAAGGVWVPFFHFEDPHGVHGSWLQSVPVPVAAGANWRMIQQMKDFSLCSLSLPFYQLKKRNLKEYWFITPISQWKNKQNVVYLFTWTLGNSNNEVVTHAILHTTLENIMLQERGRTQTTSCCMVPFIETIQDR